MRLAVLRLALVFAALALASCVTKGPWEGWKDDWWLQYNASKAAYQVGDFQEAEELMQDAYQISTVEDPPGEAMAMSLMGLATLAMDRQQWEESERLLNESASILTSREPENKTLQAVHALLEGNTNYALRRWEKSEAAYRRADLLADENDQFRREVVAGLLAVLCAQDRNLEGSDAESGLRCLDTWPVVSVYRVDSGALVSWRSGTLGFNVRFDGDTIRIAQGEFGNPPIMLNVDGQLTQITSTQSDLVPSGDGPLLARHQESTMRKQSDLCDCEMESEALPDAPGLPLDGRLFEQRYPLSFIEASGASIKGMLHLTFELDGHIVSFTRPIKQNETWNDHTESLRAVVGTLQPSTGALPLAHSTSPSTAAYRSAATPVPPERVRWITVHSDD